MDGKGGGGQPYPEGRLAVVVRLLAPLSFLLLVLLLNCCSQRISLAVPSPVETPLAAATVRLRVEAQDAEPRAGQSDGANDDLSQSIPEVILSLPDSVTFVPSAEIPLVLNTLTPVPPTETPRPVDTFTPMPPTKTMPPANTATPKPSPLPVQVVKVAEGEVEIPTYPYADFTSLERSDVFGMVYPVLDWVAYEASNPAPMNVTYRTLVLENEYLELTFLPELGGRLYEVFFKPTGNRVTYRNPVLKPNHWGPIEQGWWLAAGGFEWCLPVEEHGYEWGVPWTVEVHRDAEGATVTLRDTMANDRVRAEIAVRLESGAGHFAITPRLENPTDASIPLKYWTNAMLAPGGRNAPSADLRFILPDTVTAVTVHSRGDPFLPDYDQTMSWPIHDGVDMSRLGNWNRWLGFFEDPAVGGFMAVYDEGRDEGIVRVFNEADATRGAKGFAFGWHDPILASNWTEDGSSYVEIHGGIAATFDDSEELPPGGQLQWTEIWYPVAGLGRLRYANEIAALGLTAGEGQAHVSATPTRPWKGELVLLLDGQESWRRAVSLVPGTSFRVPVSLGGVVPQRGRLDLRLVAVDGAVAAEYGAEFDL